ncbi:MAG: zinc ABC transporter substrate-binding protein [Betaproteobacteria bacterium]|nr:zinc ABC transporter substrate-binding protein [Betaproteobacteria bacterium]
MKSEFPAMVALTTASAFFSMPVIAALNVFACEPEWASLAQELGGDRVTTYAATTAQQDAHRIEARPSLIARMRSADLVVCTGSELEIGWLPLLLTQSGNGRVRPGGDGYFEASQFVAKLEVPRIVDRAQGDVHPGGNPHIHTDARNIGRVAEALAARLAKVDAANAGVYAVRSRDFLLRWRVALARWEQQALAIKGARVIVYHREYSYLINWLGLREAGSLEPKPGLPPTPGHLAELLSLVQRDPARWIIYSPYNDPRAAAFFSERGRIPAIMLPFTVGGSDKAKDLAGLFDDTIARLLAAGK